MEVLWKAAASNGFVAVLLVATLGYCSWLVRYVLRESERREQESREREDKYVAIIDTFSRKLQADVAEIKEDVKHLFRKVGD